MKSYEELLAERDALAAQVNALWVAAQNVLGDKNPETRRRAFNVLANVVKSNPQQCLAEIKAEAGLVGYFHGTDDAWLDLTGGPSPEQVTAYRAIEYSNQVRQGEQSGTWLKDSNVNGGKRQGGAE